MSSAGLGYSITDARATFATYLNANAILAPKTDETAGKTEADADTDVIAVWGDQVDDFFDELNQILTGNLQAPGPVIIDPDATASSSDAHADADELILGNLSKAATGMTLLISASGSATYAASDSAGVIRGGLNYKDSNQEWVFSCAGTNIVHVGTAVGLRPITDNTYECGDASQRWSDLRTVTATIGGSTATGTTLKLLSANTDTAQAIWFGDADDADVGKIYYHHALNIMALHVAAQDQVYCSDGNFYPATDNDVSLGGVANRWSGFHTMAATVYGDVTLSAASPTLTVGDGTGSGVKVNDKSDAGTFQEHYQVAGVNRWIRQFAADESVKYLRYNAAGSYQADSWVLDTNGNITIEGKQIWGSSGPEIIAGSGTPESAVTAPVGSIYMRTDGGASTSIYVKESGTGNTGWVAK